MRDLFIKKLTLLCSENPAILLITGDLGFGVFDNFRKEFPSNFLNAGVAEQNMTLLATGLAKEGRIVITYSIGNFPTLRCLELIRNGPIYHKFNVKIVSIGTGYSYGALGMTHHAIEDVSVMRSFPSLRIYSPSTDREVLECTQAIIDNPGPCYLRLDKSFLTDPCDNQEKFCWTSIRILRKGDFTVIVAGGIIDEIFEAANILSRYGIELKIISCPLIKPLPLTSIIQHLQDREFLCVVEEHVLEGGLGSALCEIIVENRLKINKFLRIGIEGDYECLVGSQKFLRRRKGIDSESIASKIKLIINQR